MKKIFISFLIGAFFALSVGPLPVRAESTVMPSVLLIPPLAGEDHKVNPNDATMAVLKGLSIHPENPLEFDFIVEPSDKSNAQNAESILKEQSLKLIKYFLASLTTPETDMWVNLSPYEKNRIILDSFGQTLMGRDLLAQDYILKQMTASLIHPESPTGKQFWAKVYAQAKSQYGTTNIPINTFNKVWIMPDRATVWERGKSVFVVERHLKVMLEGDYLAKEKHRGSQISGLKSQEQGQPGDMALAVSPSRLPTKEGLNGKATQRKSPNALGSEIISELIIPQLEKEVNNGQSFAQLRQIYNAMILATWYKKRLKDSLLGTIYVDKNKTEGIKYTQTRGHDFSRVPKQVAKQARVEGESPEKITDVETIYQLYLQTFKRGIFNLIKEESDPVTGQIIPRKYYFRGDGGSGQS